MIPRFRPEKERDRTFGAACGAFRLRLLLTPFLVAATTLAASLARSAVLPVGFELQPVIVGVFEPGRPVAFAQLPDGRFLILERRTSQIRLHPVGSAVAPVIQFVPDVDQTGERGLLGVAVDPQWPARPYIYLHYSHASGKTRVAMWQGHGDLDDPTSPELFFDSEFLLLDDIPDTNPVHNGGTVRFDSAGMLYVSLGDDSVRCDAQARSVLAGKILRLDVSCAPGQGPGPPAKSAITPRDNPFSGPEENDRLVWAWGLRNPFRFTIDPTTNDLFVGDVGEGDWEEVDHLPASLGGGENFGWPHYEGNVDPGFDLDCGRENAFTSPAYVYPNDAIASVIVGPCYRRRRGTFDFPVEYEGAVLVSDLWLGWLRWIVRSPSGWNVLPEVPGQPNGTDWASEVFSTVDIQQGLDGAIYLLQLAPNDAGPSGLYRIVPTTTSVPGPTRRIGEGVVRADPNPASIETGTTIRWTGTRGSFTALRIVNAEGRAVRVVDTPACSAAPGAIAAVDWDLRSSAGELVPSGVYILCVEFESGREIEGKVLVIR